VNVTDEGSRAWRQLDFFGQDEDSSFISTAQTPIVARAGSTGQRRLSYARVTRDPAVALSSAANHSHAADLSASLATFVSGLSDERRCELRRRLGLPDQAGSTIRKRVRDGRAA
jgi:hypothetical protein